MKFYHGSDQTVEKPDLTHSRVNIDFGAGFYVSQDLGLAEKWAGNKRVSVVTEYEMAETVLENLKTYHFSLDEEWLYFVVQNRNEYEIDFEYENYDVLYGPIANDKMFRTLQEFENGELTVDQTLEILTIAGFSEQYNFRTEKSIHLLNYCGSRVYSEEERRKIRKERAEERKGMEDRIAKIKGNHRPVFRPRKSE